MYFLGLFKTFESFLTLIKTKNIIYKVFQMCTWMRTTKHFSINVINFVEFYSELKVAENSKLITEKSMVVKTEKDTPLLVSF